MVGVGRQPQDRPNRGFSPLNMNPSVRQMLGFIPAFGLTRNKLPPCLISPGLTPRLEAKVKLF